MILLSGVISWKTLAMLGGFAILIYGIFLGSGKKDNNKDTSRHYDAREKNQLMDAAKRSDINNYVTKGSGYYRDKNGKIHKEK